ncbi:C3HC zinc finger-like-domain-containing protein [Mycena sanguinolenta]|nr:C3HC zinc finger-like-domain-containing protein [Mycena sanguinolenta]
MEADLFQSLDGDAATSLVSFSIPLASSSSSGATPSPLLSTEDLLSVPSFHARLATFRLATYANKPPQLDAVAAAKCGWMNDGRDCLVCGACEVSWFVAEKDGVQKLPKNEADVLVEEQRVALVGAHKDHCPWKARQCDENIYRVPLQAPEVMICEIERTAALLDPLMQQVEIKHPLIAMQLVSLLSIISPDLSETAVLAALFGWTPVRPTAPSWVPLCTTTSFPAASTLRKQHSTTSVLQCALCHHRIGLWMFAPPTPFGIRSDGQPPATPQRPLDLLNEHRPFCAYRVESTVPSLSAVDMTTSSAASNDISNAAGGNDAVEGWRAVLAVTLQCQLRQTPRERDAVGIMKRHISQPEDVHSGGVEMDEDNTWSRKNTDADNASAELVNEDLPPCTPAFGEGPVILSGIQHTISLLTSESSMDSFPPRELPCPLPMNSAMVPQLVLETAEEDGGGTLRWPRPTWTCHTVSQGVGGNCWYPGSGVASKAPFNTAAPAVGSFVGRDGISLLST